ncbi:FAD-dependent oxidoreductase [Aestuariirhabdus sp. Z084]|uniref:NAD(P)/FAD-dependent oxidoreductase n=1 Tax=Aestuariirhabdus haliotis TaxID=2918751 RepID=UPI00201B4275|nr:FAD-dependent oxidoreductase [Aestuariirhabdus haliotis]MCL6417357.1 FAD-dependent oxidoreductase [Aestuariirhabdus haliotis]MCL6421302.1 FAD-dependent oxidoreductase [Aestuariirhabdus haliotis]
MNKPHAIIVGASHAGAQLATSLRQQGWPGSIVLIGDETSPPYQRPPLSKDFLTGKRDEQTLLIRPAELYARHEIELRLNTRVEAIHPDTRQLKLADGETLHYDKLALCTGARVRRIEAPGSQLEGICYLRTLSDVQTIAPRATEGKRAVIIGGGYIGLETAAVLKTLGMEVTVLEMMDRVLQRVTAEPVSDFYTRVHREQGVNIELSTRLKAFEGSTHIEQVLCEDGRRFPADLVIVGIGVLPNQELAAEAGLSVDNGILVDKYALTSDPHIVAAGDCTNHPNELLGKRLRLESVPNAMEQAKCAAATLCGKPSAYNSHPWFWSDQYDMKLQIAGLNQDYDQVVLRGDPTQGRSFVAWYLKQGKLLAADCINRPKEFMVAKQLLARGTAIDATQLADEQLEPSALLA